MRVTTEAARAGESFDFWHSLFPHIEMRRTTREDGYGAAALACAGDDGIAFTDLVCAPTASRFFAGRCDHMQLCAVVEGQFGVKLGSASVRGRVCQYVYISVVAVLLIKNNL